MGLAYAKAQSAAGASLASVDLAGDRLTQAARLIESGGGHAMAFPGDVSDRPAVEQVVVAAEQQLGPVDVLVNNAGVLTPVGPDWEVDPDQWWHTLEVNLRGPFLFARSVLPSMIARRRGSIINIPSAGAYIQHPLLSAYACSKAAVTQMTNCLAGATEGLGISVFAYAPGVVRSAMTEYLVDSPEAQNWYGDQVPGRVRGRPRYSH